MTLRSDKGGQSMQKRIVHSGFLLSLALVIVFALGCNRTQSPEQQVDDTAITAEVKTKLATDVELATITGIEVNTTNGVVTLAGEVASADLKDRVEKVVKSVDGVVRVTNNIRVAGA
jgi:osmotically-inducible protein OsmY